MQVDTQTRKKANLYFFSKVAVNALLVILGAVLIALFLRQMQNRTALVKQQQNSEQALTEAVSILEQNARDAADLTEVFHDGNQDMLDDLYALITGGLFDSLASADNAARTEVFLDIIQRSGVDYLLIMSDEGKVLLSPYEEFYGVDLVEYGLLTPENLEKLVRGTQQEDGSVSPVLENNDYGYFYFYSTRCSYEGTDFVLVLGSNAVTLDIQIASLKDVSVVLSRAAVGNNGFLFAVNAEDDSFLYYQNGSEILTGTSASAAGLSEQALQDGYVGIETINGVRYHCVSRSFGSSTVVCAVAETEEIFVNDKYVLFWSVAGFVLVMVLCLGYAVIVRNDFVRNAVETKKIIFRQKKGSPVIFDKSVFKKVFPLMIVGVLLIFGISFYTQTLLEISEAIENSVIALDEVTGRYEESTANRQVIQNYYNNRFLAKARLIAYLLEEDPSVLNEPSARYHSYYDENGNKIYLTDDEGNRLKSVSLAPQLQELCRQNDIESIYIFDEDGRVIATSTPNWYFSISHNEEDQSYPFLQVLDQRLDVYVQDPMVNDIGYAGQYIGVAFTYYTTLDEDGNTVYASHYDYEVAQGNLPDANGEIVFALTLEDETDAGQDAEDAAIPAEPVRAPLPAEDAAAPITMHRSMLQIGLDSALSEQVLASTDLDYVFSTDALRGGFIVLFDAGEEHFCLYSPVEARIGMTAEELGIPPMAFSGDDYYGFTRVSGNSYFQYYRYVDGYFIATAIPRAGMYQSRTTIALITSVTSLLLILILSLTVTLTTEEEELLYATMSDAEAESRLDSTIFSVILPSGHRVNTVKAAARWDNQGIPWQEKSPEQKLITIISVLLGILVLYVLIAVLAADRLFEDGSVVQYILSGDWDKGLNIFALSAAFLVLIFTAIGVSLFRIPVKLLTSLLGARGETIGHLLLSVVKYGGAIGAIFYALYLIGMDSTSLLASAGVLSLVIGLGAQSLIKDILAGIFIVFEGEFRVGDIVTISGYRGTVMDIGLRTTKIMAPDGNVKIYNNSEISGVLNMTKEASVAATRISIEYGQDIDYVEAVLERELPGIRERDPRILDGPTNLGVAELGESGVTLLIICKCSEQDIKGVNRYLNREVLKIFYRNGINVPFPNVTLSQLDASGRKTLRDLQPTPEEQQESE